MKQTEKLGLNLIETGDAFSPEPLNENTRILETALEKKGTCSVYVGYFSGNGVNGREIEVGFAPKMVILMGNVGNSYSIGVLVPGQIMYTVTGGTMAAGTVAITGNGFRISESNMYNMSGRDTRYIAFA